MMEVHPMSNWGTATFDSEVAIRWVEAFAADPKVETLEEAFESLGRAREDVGVAHSVLAAAEVVAAWCGRPAADLPVNLTAWMMGRSQVLPPELLEAARDAAIKVGRSSALRELWRDRKRLEAWESDVLALVERLGTTP